MNWDQFEDPLCYLCFRGVVLASLSLIQELVGSNAIFYKTFVPQFAENSENIQDT